MKVRTRQTKNFSKVCKLNDIIFPGEPLDVTKSTYGWISVDVISKREVGFCTATDFGHKILFLSRCGVRECYRGHNLQRRLIRIRLNFARKKGFEKVITYVRSDNYSSLCNLIKCGFYIYDPEFAYVGKEDYIYLIKEV